MYQPTERWKVLCQQAAAEQDGVRLLEIIDELNRVLDGRGNGPEKKAAFPAGSLKSSKVSHHKGDLNC